MALRVVSLLPSATEIVCALGAEAELVGISHECDFPETLRGRPVLTHSRLDAGAASGDIDPDVVLVKPCGFVLERTLGERATITRQILSQLPPSVRVYAADGNAFFNRPGPRLVESLEILAACVHPKAFADGTERHRTAFTALTGGA